ncbi:hypothetical protein HMPREF3039_00082 [Akkermansia sp. KLE1798]|nr:hypothetical protein HMPREF3039_00082 [Akkermansia sp. KLE1798]
MAAAAVLFSRMPQEGKLLSAAVFSVPVFPGDKNISRSFHMPGVYWNGWTVCGIILAELVIIKMMRCI